MNGEKSPSAHHLFTLCQKLKRSELEKVGLVKVRLCPVTHWNDHPQPPSSGTPGFPPSLALSTIFRELTSLILTIVSFDLCLLSCLILPDRRNLENESKEKEDMEGPPRVMSNTFGVNWFVYFLLPFSFSS